jgi:hypothetical protein
MARQARVNVAIQLRWAINGAPPKTEPPGRVLMADRLVTGRRVWRQV